ncbi:MAG: tetratricopeptide repeat protein [Planctomycetota bacterium]|nr:tetratricopeptide repeat protein [Planctomycetota bacterium]
MRLSKKAKRRLVVLTAVAVMAVIGVSGVKMIRAHQQERLIAAAHEKGAAAYERGDLQTALDELKYYVQHKKHDPEVVETLLDFADARRRLPLPNAQHLVEAMGYYHHARKLLDNHPDLPGRDALLLETQRKLLELYALLGMRVELVETADRVLAGHPDDTDALAARARALYLDRELAEALKSAERLVAIEPADPAWRHLQLQIMQGMAVPDDELIAQCDRWIDAWDGDGRLHLLKAGWLAELGRMDEARRVAEIAAERGADTLEILQHTVSLLDLLQMSEIASTVLADARQRFPQEQWVPEATVRRLWQAGRVDEALAELERAERDFDSLDSGLLRLSVVVLVAAEREEEARPALEQLEAAAIEGEAGRGDRAWAEALRARLHLTESTWREAVEAYQRALAADGDDPILHFLLGEAYAMAGEHALAVEAYGRAFTRQPSWLVAGATYAEALLTAGRPHEAFRIASTLLDRAPEGRLSVYLLVARTYLASLKAGGDPVIVEADTSRSIDIVQLLSAMREQLPQRGDVSILLARACCLTGRLREAQGVVREELSAEAPNTNVLLPLARISRRHGLNLEGELLARARELDGLTIPIALARAELLLEQDRGAEGLALIDRAIGLAPPEKRNAPETRRARCEYLVRIDHPEALSALADLIDDPAQPVPVLLFVLSQPEVWEEETLARAAVDRLERRLGEHAPQVRLAEANAMLRFRGDEEARRAKAIVMIGDVLEQCPDSLPALILMAQASLVGENPSPDRAIEHLQRAVNLAPGRSDLLVRLIALLQRAGDYETADRYLAHLSRLAEYDPGAMRSEMRLRHVQGDFEGALLRFGGAVDEDAPVADQLVLAALHARAGEHDAAEAIYQRLLRITDHDGLVAAQAAEFYANTGRFEKGLALFGKVGEEEAPLLKGGFYLRHSRFDEAERWLTKTLEAEPESVEAHHQLARLYAARAQPEKAREYALAGLRLEPRHAGLRATLAMANIGADASGRGEAIKLLRELGRENDSLLDTLTLLEQIPVEDGRTSPTDVNLQAARTLTEAHPQFLPAWLLAITLHREAGQMRETIDLARRAVGRFPAHAEPAEWASRLLIDAGRWSEALVEAREWRRRSLDRPLSADLALATILLRLDRPGDAAETLAPYADRFASRRDAEPDRFALWLTTLVQAGRAHEAWEIIRAPAAEDDQWQSVWIDLAGIAEYETAKQMLAWLAPVAAEDSALATLRLAQGYSALGWRFQRDECFDRAENLIGDEPADGGLRLAWLFLRARIAEGRGELAEAERLYRAVLAEQPDAAAALNNLAFVLTRSPDRCAEALPYAERALAAEPDQPDLLDTYSRVLLCLGRTGEARDALERALQDRPNDITLNLSLAELFIRIEAFDDARAALETARRELDRLALAESALEKRIDAVARQLRNAVASADS